MFLKMSQNSQETSVSQAPFTVPDVRNTTLLKRDSDTGMSISARSNLRKSLLNAGV